MAISGYDPIAYFAEMKPVKGSPEFHLEYQGSTFHFRIAANRDRFADKSGQVRTPVRRLLRFRQWPRGTKLPSILTPSRWWARGFISTYSETVRSRWLSDIPGYIRQADANWPDVKKLTKVREGS